MELADVPDGAMVSLDQVLRTNSGCTVYLVRGEHLLPWRAHGYGDPIARADARVWALTPPSIRGALRHGYDSGQKYP